MWLCMWKLTISEEILIWFLDYFNIFALCEQCWKFWILGPLLRQKGSHLGPPFAKNWVPFGSPFYNFWVPLRFGNSGNDTVLHLESLNFGFGSPFGPCFIKKPSTFWVPISRFEVPTWCPKKNFFFDLSFVLLTTHAIGLEEPSKKFSAL